MMPLTTLWDEFTDRPKSTYEKTHVSIYAYISSPTKMRQNN